VALARSFELAALTIEQGVEGVSNTYLSSTSMPIHTYTSISSMFTIPGWPAENKCVSKVHEIAQTKTNKGKVREKKATQSVACVSRTYIAPFPSPAPKRGLQGSSGPGSCHPVGLC
jgi:hypothetical protein